MGTDFSISSAGTPHIHFEKIKWNLALITDTNINLIYIKDLNITTKTIKLPEENRRASSLTWGRQRFPRWDTNLLLFKRHG